MKKIILSLLLAANCGWGASYTGIYDKWMIQSPSNTITGKTSLLSDLYVNGLIYGTLAGGLPPGSTNYIWNTNALQSGAKFFVSSGTSYNFYACTATIDHAIFTRNTQLGTPDAYGREQLWLHGTNSILRIGADGADGDPFNEDSEGIVIYHPSNDQLARIKADRLGLTRASDSSLYYFRVDQSSIFYKADPSTGPVWFNVNRVTGNTSIKSPDSSHSLTIGAGGTGKIIAEDPFNSASEYMGFSFNGDFTNPNIFSGTSDKILYLQRPTGYDIYFREDMSNPPQMRILSGGNVSIGTESPTHLFHVRGDDSGYLGYFYNQAPDADGVFIHDYASSGVGYGLTSESLGLGPTLNYGGVFIASGASIFNMGVYGHAVGTSTNYAGYFQASGGTSNYGIYSDAESNYFTGNLWVSSITAGTGFYGNGSGLTGIVYTESDPVFMASTAAAIVSTDIARWNSAFVPGSQPLNMGIYSVESSSGANFAGNVAIGTTSANYALRVQGGILAFSSITAANFYGNGTGIYNVIHSESDPIFSASTAATITASSITHWNSAIYTELDPVFTASTAAAIVSTDIARWNSAFVPGSGPLYMNGYNVESSSGANFTGWVTAGYFYGDGSGLSNLPSASGDSLGTHIATESLKMGGYSIESSSGANFTGEVRASTFIASGSAFLISGTTITDAGIDTKELCVAGDCKTAWPPSGGGGPANPIFIPLPNGKRTADTFAPLTPAYTFSNQIVFDFSQITSTNAIFSLIYSIADTATHYSLCLPILSTAIARVDVDGIKYATTTFLYDTGLPGDNEATSEKIAWPVLTGTHTITIEGTGKSCQMNQPNVTCDSAGLGLFPYGAGINYDCKLPNLTQNYCGDNSNLYGENYACEIDIEAYNYCDSAGQCATGQAACTTHEECGGTTCTTHENCGGLTCTTADLSDAACYPLSTPEVLEIDFTNPLLMLR